jgi:hypothetical protein
MVLICGLLVELEVRVREESHLLAPGRDRRARNDGVVASISQAIEDPIEIVASVLYLVPSQTEIFADQPHEFDIEAGLCTVDSNLERWIGESRRHSQYSRLEREFCHVRPPVASRVIVLRTMSDVPARLGRHLRVPQQPLTR